MDKRQRILDAMAALMEEGRAGTASVADIARKAGIAKGGMYYYFRSKEQVVDALVSRTYQNVIGRCREAVAQSGLDAPGKMALLLRLYKSAAVSTSLDGQLHAPENAAIHQKSLAEIVTALTPILSDILSQGVEEGAFQAEYPHACAQIVLSVFAFLLDPGLFACPDERVTDTLKALAQLLEKGLSAKAGSFAFLYGALPPGQIAGRKGE